MSSSSRHAWTGFSPRAMGIAAAVVTVLFLGEPLRWNLAVGLALVALGILFGVHTAIAIATKDRQA